MATSTKIQLSIVVIMIAAQGLGQFTPAAARQTADQIVYAAGKNGEHQLYTMNADGSAPHALTTQGDNIEPNWSPDRTKIVYTAKGDPPSGQLHVINADGSGDYAITTVSGGKVAGGSEATWSPDGRYLVFTSNPKGNQELFVTNADGTSIRQLTRSDPTNPNDAHTPVWASDGSITFIYDKDISDVYAINADGSNLRQITHNESGTNASNPVWSPDGMHLAYILNAGHEHDIYISDNKGSNLTKVTTMNGKDVASLSWSPDGTKISFDAWPNNKPHAIYIIAADGSGAPTQVTKTDGGTESGWPSWSNLKPSTVPALAALPNSDGSTSTSDNSPGSNTTIANAAPIPVKLTAGLTATQPNSVEQLKSTPSVWATTSFRNMTSPGTERYSTPLSSQTPVWRFAFKWCAGNGASLDYITAPMTVKLVVNDQVIDNSAVLVFDLNNCRTWATLLSDWKAGTTVNLKIHYDLSQTLLFNTGTDDPGAYDHILTVKVS